MQRKRRVSLELARPARAYWLIVIVLLAVDQLTKVFIRTNYHPGETLVLIPNVLEIVRVGNEGAAFGMFPGGQVVFMITSIIFLIAIAIVWRRYHPASLPVVVGLALVSTGAAGNLIDRAFIGTVTDFIYFKPIDFPVFNVADACITIGVILLMICVLFAPEKPTEKPTETPSGEA